jgi:hypothetical protein
VLNTVRSAVVSSERLVLWRSEIFGGISNEISVILDQSSLLQDMRGLLFCPGAEFIFDEKFNMQLRDT